MHGVKINISYFQHHLKLETEFVVGWVGLAILLKKKNFPNLNNFFCGHNYVLSILKFYLDLLIRLFIYNNQSKNITLALSLNHHLALY